MFNAQNEYQSGLFVSKQLVIECPQFSSIFIKLQTKKMCMIAQRSPEKGN